MQGNSKTRQRYGRGIRVLASLLPLAVAPQSVLAEGWEFGGHLKYQYSVTDYSADNIAAIFGEDPARDQSFDGRLKSEGRGRGFDFTAQGKW